MKEGECHLKGRMGPFQLGMLSDSMMPIRHVCRVVIAAALWVSKGPALCGHNVGGSPRLEDSNPNAINTGCIS